MSGPVEDLRPSSEMLRRCGWLRHDWSRGRFVTPLDWAWWWMLRADVRAWPYRFGQHLMICWVPENAYWHQGEWVWPWEWMRRVEAEERKLKHLRCRHYLRNFLDNGWDW